MELTTLSEGHLSEPRSTYFIKSYLVVSLISKSLFPVRNSEQS